MFLIRVALDCRPGSTTNDFETGMPTEFVKSTLLFPGEIFLSESLLTLFVMAA